MNSILFTKNFQLILLIIMSLFLITYAFLVFKNNKKISNIIKYLFCFILFVYTIGFLYSKIFIPTIKLDGSDNVSISINEDYVDSGYKVYQFNRKLNVKLNIINEVNNKKIGVYKVKYVLNYYGEDIIRERIVKVIDNVKPEITLKGDNEVNIFLNQEYIEDGYVAIDNYDGNITNKVSVSNNIKNEVGKYQITYNITDKSGNTSSVIRTINILLNNKGIIYLTFDDGPSVLTNKFLDILKKENVKATFFVVGFDSSMNDVVKRIVDEGHTIALHSYTHKFNEIYSSEKAFFEDLDKIKQEVKDVTGVDSMLYRFPGGSSNTRSCYNKGIMTRLTKEIVKRGYHYFDWNVSSRDAEGAKNSNEVYNSVISTLSKKRSNVVIMHNHKYSYMTLNALEDIIETAKKRGYTFDKITYYTPIVKHNLFN